MRRRRCDRRRGDKADAKLTIGAVAGAAPGHIAPEAPLDFSVSGDIPSLQLLQPWISTAAVVSGRLHVDVAARGTVAEPALSGAVLGEGLRIDAPQYGLHYTNGRLAARAANDRIDIDDLTLGAGDRHLSCDRVRSAALPLAERSRSRSSPGRRNNSARSIARTCTLSSGARAAPSPRTAGSRFPASFAPTKDRSSIWHTGLHPRRRRRRQRLDPSDHGPAARRRSAACRRSDARSRRASHVLGRGHRDAAGRVGARHDRSERSQRQGLDPHGTRHVLRVRPAAHDRTRSAHIRRTPRQSGPRHRGAAQESRGRGGSDRHRNREGPGHPAHLNPPVPDSESCRGSFSEQGNTTSGADLAALQAASAALLGAHGKPVSASIAQSIGLDTITFKGAERPRPTGAPARKIRSSPSASGCPTDSRSSTSRASPSRPIRCGSNTN